MELTKLKNRAQFNTLQPTDIVIVEWKPGSREYTQGLARTAHHIWGINGIDELILDKETNTYFSIRSYLAGKSTASAAYVVK